MTLVLSIALAGPTEGLDTAPRTAPWSLLGSRLEADGVGSAVGVDYTLVAGPDGGGVRATTYVARLGREDWSIAAHVPFARYRTPIGQTTALGNLRVEFFRRLVSGETVQLVGVELHAATGRAWTWAHDAVSLWPSSGVTAVYQRRQPFGRADLLLRGSLGLYRTLGVAPFPLWILHGSGAAGVDLPLEHRFRVGTEIAVSGWDPSPLDLTGWVGWNVLDGVRLQGALLAPVGSWMGLSPGKRPAGIREITARLRLDLAR